MGQQFYVNKDINFLIDKDIQEWDVERAGLTALLDLGLISKDTYDYWKARDKMSVSIYIGSKMPKTMSKQNDRITRAVDEFLKENDVITTNLISRKKDAVFLFNTRIKSNRIGYYYFRSKNKYTSYYKFGDKELYFNSNKDILDIKGVDQRFYKNHQLIPFIKDIMVKFELLQKKFITYRELYNSLHELRSRYVNFELPLGCYRELNYGNWYRCVSEDDESTVFGEDYINEDTMHGKRLLINYNFMNYIVPFINILTNFTPTKKEKEKYRQEWKRNRW